MFTQSFVSVELKLVQLPFEVSACGRCLIFRSVIRDILCLEPNIGHYGNERFAIFCHAGRPIRSSCKAASEAKSKVRGRCTLSPSFFTLPRRSANLSRKACFYLLFTLYQLVCRTAVKVLNRKTRA